ncbi:MAG TPA: hypothetical protein VL426_06615 [Candidatus Binatia bacterium]|nr:hypothetical protein [Candidatus Binatia bacterium]
MHIHTLAGFVARNQGGRALFLSVPVAIGAAVHAAAYAVTGEPYIGAFIGGLAALIAMMWASWRWLDEEAAVALERKYERGSIIALAIAIPLLLISPQLMAGAMVAGVASFGASCGIVRIAAYVDAPDAPAGASRLGTLAWLCQATALGACLASATPVTAAIAVLLSTAAAVAATTLPKEELAAIVD